MEFRIFFFAKKLPRLSCGAMSRRNKARAHAGEKIKQEYRRLLRRRMGKKQRDESGKAHAESEPQTYQHDAQLTVAQPFKQERRNRLQDAPQHRKRTHKCAEGRACAHPREIPHQKVPNAKRKNCAGNCLFRQNDAAALRQLLFYRRRMGEKLFIQPHFPHSSHMIWPPP